jgi:hypothetical protein
MGPADGPLPRQVQVIAMSATQQTRIATRPVTPHVDHRPAACGCGQELDVAAGAHCPRCGTQLGGAHVEPVGFWVAA